MWGGGREKTTTRATKSKYQPPTDSTENEKEFKTNE